VTLYRIRQRADYYAGVIRILCEVAAHAVLCRLDRHDVPFTTWPKCTWCGKSVQA
jgi:hypothetical protein